MANQLKYVFRLTHIDNIKYIMSKGLVRASSPLRDENYVSIGDVQVIQVRKDRKYQGYQLSRVSSSLFLKTSWKHPC